MYILLNIINFSILHEQIYIYINNKYKYKNERDLFYYVYHKKK